MNGTTTNEQAVDAPSVARPRGLWALWAACVLGGLGQSLAGTAGSLVAEHVGGTPAVAGLPQAMQVGGTAVAAIVLSRMTGRAGRRAALVAGAAAGTMACGLAFTGAVAFVLWPVLAGSALIGAGNAAVLLSRYAAADMVPDAARARAMGQVLTITTLGAVAGPNLLPVATLWPHAADTLPLAGAYVLAGAAFLAGAVVLVAGMPAGRGAVPVPPASDPGAGPVTGPAEAAADPDDGLVGARPPSAAPGLTVLGLANVVMIGVMTMAPVHLDHAGVGLGVVGLVVSVHIAAMFAPSMVSAEVVKRLGSRSAAVVSGLVMLAASLLAAVTPDSFAGMLTAMALLGLGWNLALIAGSTLLTEAVPPHARTRREGRGEFVMNVAAAGAGVVCGPVMAFAGYPVLAVLGAVVCLGLLAVPWVAPRTHVEIPTSA